MWSNNSGMSSVALCFCFCCVFGSCLIRILNGVQINPTDIFMLFLSNSRQILWQYLQLGQNHFLTLASLFFSRSLTVLLTVKCKKKYMFDARQKIIQIWMTVMSGSHTSPTISLTYKPHNIVHIQAPQHSSTQLFSTVSHTPHFLHNTAITSHCPL